MKVACRVMDKKSDICPKSKREAGKQRVHIQMER